MSTASTPLSARSMRTRRAVLEATAALLTEGGLAAATIDAISDRSTISKTTIYKHWPNRLCVAVDAFADTLAVQTVLPDTGTARGDFTAQLRRVAAFYSSPIGGAFAQLQAAAMQDPTAAEWLRRRLDLSRRHGIGQLWDQAVARGEVRRHIDPNTAMDLLFGPLMWRLLSGRTPPSGEDIDQITDAALTGLLG